MRRKTESDKKTQKLWRFYEKEKINYWTTKKEQEEVLI